MRGLATGGICPCSGTLEERAVEVRIAREPEPLLLVDVPQQVCQVCGSRLYPAAVLRRVEAAWRQSRPPGGE